MYRGSALEDAMKILSNLSLEKSQVTVAEEESFQKLDQDMSLGPGIQLRGRACA